jgi:LAS seventeen-binding protein 5
MHRQLRALTILDGLIQNAGARFQRTFADEPLLERLRMMPRDDLVDPDVRSKCNNLYRQWAVSYKKTPGLEKITALYKQLPQTKKLQPSQSRVIRETEAEAARDAHVSPPTSPVQSRNSSVSTTPSSSWTSQRPVGPGSTTSSSFFRSKDKKSKIKNFNLEKEKPQLMETIAQASVASTNLINAVKLINRENQRVSENVECKNRFETCKVLRRRILRYIQFVESEQFIGSLLSANDELVKALMAYEVMDKSIEDDSDSDVEAYQAGKQRFERSGRFSTETTASKWNGHAATYSNLS